MLKGVLSTVHADKRARQRIGIKDPSKMFEDALLYGFKIGEAKGQFRKYLDRMSIIHKSTPVIYKGNVFCHRKGLLITVFPLHHKWNKYMETEKQKAVSENEKIREMLNDPEVIGKAAKGAIKAQRKMAGLESVKEERHDS